jgi:hypothetical protein
MATAMHRRRSPLAKRKRGPLPSSRTRCATCRPYSPDLLPAHHKLEARRVPARGRRRAPRDRAAGEGIATGTPPRFLLGQTITVLHDNIERPIPGLLAVSTNGRPDAPDIGATGLRFALSSLAPPVRAWGRRMPFAEADHRAARRGRSGRHRPGADARRSRASARMAQLLWRKVTAQAEASARRGAGRDDISWKDRRGNIWRR